MRNFTIYLAGLLCLVASKMIGQETTTVVTSNTPKSFEVKAKDIANKIEMVTKAEKKALKEEVDAVNRELEAGTITSAQAETKKRELATKRAANIETQVDKYEAELKQLVQDKVDGKIAENDSVHTRTFTFRWSSKKDTLSRYEARTTTQFVFALGANNLVTNGAVANSDFRYAGSHFYEWGTTWNTRLLKNDNLLHLKYGFSVQYNNLRATDNRYFVDNGETTDLVTNPVHMDDSRFRNVNLVVPMHLEFDFSGNSERDGKRVFRTQQSFRMGLGGYAGVNLKSKQIIKYDNDDYKTRNITKGSFNTNDFIYGLSAYVGYKETSLYVKYDLNPLFKDNAVAQRNVSLGLRFDLN